MQGCRNMEGGVRWPRERMERYIGLGGRQQWEGLQGLYNLTLTCKLLTKYGMVRLGAAKVR